MLRPLNNEAMQSFNSIKQTEHTFLHFGKEIDFRVFVVFVTHVYLIGCFFINVHSVGNSIIDFSSKFLRICLLHCRIYNAVELFLAATMRVQQHRCVFYLKRFI